MNPRKILQSLSIFVSFVVAAAADTTLIDHTFDGVANDSGGLTFQQVKNTLSNGESPVGSSNPTTGVITTGTGTGAQTTSSAVGFNTTSPFNVNTAAPDATGFAVTFHVAGTTADVASLLGNGLFFGAVTGSNANGTGGSSLWNNDPYAIGYVSSSQSNVYGNHLLRQDAELGGNANSANNTSLGTAPSLASYQDGFTITLSLFNDETWSLTSTGLSTDIDSTGSLAIGTGMKTYAEIAAAVTPYVSLQGQAAGTITIERITLTEIDSIPDPTLIDYTFDSNTGNEVGPAVQVIDNGVSTGAANPSTGVITTGTSNNHTLGFNSSGAVDLSSFLGLEASFVVDSITTSNVAGLLNNGLFFGVVAGTNATGTAGNSLWNNDPRAFGYVPGSGAWGDHVMAENTGSLSITNSSLTTAQPTNASLLDGFTVTIKLFADNTWRVSSTGLSTELDQSGTLPNLTFADFANAGIYVSLQGQSGAQIDMGRMTLTGLSEGGTSDPPPNPGYTSPFVDTDQDSYRDEAETALGSDPNDPADLPDHTPNPAKPNIVIIYADDLGFGDISRYATLFGTDVAAPTPHVDALSAQGVTFTQAHSANGVCTPSRYSLLTGNYNFRHFDGISLFYGAKGGIDNIPLDSDVTIADFLKTKGYDTAAFGKWHLGGKWYAPGTNNRITNNPTDPMTVDWLRRIEGHATDIGFDYFRGLAASINIGPYVYLHNDIVQYWMEDASTLNQYGNKLPNGRKGYFRNATSSDTFSWLTQAQLNSTVVGGKDGRESLGDPSYRQIDPEPVMIADFESYIANRVTAGDTDPLFAYVALYSPHLPWAITPEFNNSTYGSYDYARWMAEVDDRIGRIVAAIDNNGMGNDTMIILTSDNGPEALAMTRTLANGDDANGPLRGAKRDIWEGGTRVPFIVRWPGQAPAGMVVTDELISQVDIFPTVAAFLGEEIPTTIAPDGESFLNVLRGQRKPGNARGGIVISSVSGHNALKTPDGWKLVDSTGGGGNTNSWDSENTTIPNAIGTNQGTPKQLFELPIDLGEDHNKISSLADDSAIRAGLVTLTGRDLLGILDQLRTAGATALFGREPDNDADGISNSFETTHGLDRDSPKDAALDSDGDGADNLSESIAGTDPNDPGSVLRVIDLADTPETFSITWPSVSGRNYEVFWSTDITTWTSDSIHPGTGSDIIVTLSKATIDAADGIEGNLRTLFVRVGVTK
jgi:arylsulfatase A-like enzyme